MAGGQVVGAIGGRARGTRIYSVAFSLLVGRRVTDATNGFRIFRTELLSRRRRSTSISDGSTATTSSRTCSTAPSRVAIGSSSSRCTVRYHRNESYTKMRGVKDWWRLFRPALLLRTGVKR